MKNKTVFVSLLAAAILLTSCRLNRPDRSSESPTNAPATEAVTVIPSFTSQPQIQSLQFVTGRNDYVMDVDGTPREFIVYVPSGYDPNLSTPVVVMCHGSNQDPDDMFENTGWVKKAEEETIIVVFPASWKYPLVTENGVHEKWNTPGTAQEVVPGTELMDDVKFIRTIIENLKFTFNVDEKRIYASGFSNGGGFVLTRLIPLMNDVFAAYSTAGAGLFGEATAEDVPIQVSASLYSILGTNDNKIGENQGIPTPFPLDAQQIVDDPFFFDAFMKTTALLNLEETYTVESDPNFTRFIFDSVQMGGFDNHTNQYVFMMIRGMAHVYPNGENRAGIDGADEFWVFFLKHPKP